MSEFYDWPLTEVQPDDFLVVGRGRSSFRAKAGKLLLQPSDDSSLPELGSTSAIAFSKTPPEEKNLWFQLDDNDLPVELWQRRPGDIWVSDQQRIESAFEYEVKRNLSYFRPLATRSFSIWVERLTACAWVQDSMKSNEHIDFNLALVDTEQKSTPLHYLRLSGAARGDVFDESESVETAVSLAEVMALQLSISRKGQTKLKTASLSVTFRNIYAESRESTAAGN